MIAIGMDGMAWLFEEDQFKVSLMDNVYAEAVQARKLLDGNLAAQITNYIGKLLGG